MCATQTRKPNVHINVTGPLRDFPRLFPYLKRFLGKLFSLAFFTRLLRQRDYPERQDSQRSAYRVA